ncbi:MAG: hypothetical protein JW748_04940 [Anaerolineales bacterium]|nr:hypothetical protein [Anaerolineales bacterium]
MDTHTGLWIDHRKAVIVIIKGEVEEIRTITSGVGKHTRYKTGKSDEVGSAEDIVDRKFGNELNSYYDEVIAVIRDADAVRIFGPGEAKRELEHRMERAGLKKLVAAVETVDKMTDRQIAAKARDFLRS